MLYVINMPQEKPNTPIGLVLNERDFLKFEKIKEALGIEKSATALKSLIRKKYKELYPNEKGEKEEDD
jgi:hypothetical protein